MKLAQNEATFEHDLIGFHATNVQESKFLTLEETSID